MPSTAWAISPARPRWSEYLPRARDLFLEHHCELDFLVTHRLPIQEAEKAFLLFENHADGMLKVILDASAWDSGRRSENRP